MKKKKEANMTTPEGTEVSNEIEIVNDNVIAVEQKAIKEKRNHFFEFVNCEDMLASHDGFADEDHKSIKEKRDHFFEFVNCEDMPTSYDGFAEEGEANSEEEAESDVDLVDSGINDVLNEKYKLGGESTVGKEVPPEREKQVALSNVISQNKENRTVFDIITNDRIKEISNQNESMNEVDAVKTDIIATEHKVIREKTDHFFEFVNCEDMSTSYNGFADEANSEEEAESDVDLVDYSGITDISKEEYKLGGELTLGKEVYPKRESQVTLSNETSQDKESRTVSDIVSEPNAGEKKEVPNQNESTNEVDTLKTDTEEHKAIQEEKGHFFEFVNCEDMLHSCDDFADVGTKGELTGVSQTLRSGTNEVQVQLPQTKVIQQNEHDDTLPKIKNVYSRVELNSLPVQQLEEQQPSTSNTTVNIKEEEEEEINGSKNIEEDDLDNNCSLNLLRCCLCDFKTNELHTLEKHGLIHSYIHYDRAKKNIYSCFKCSFSTRIMPVLRKHILTEHTNSLSYISLNSQTKFFKKIPRNFQKDKPPTLLYKCSICGFITSPLNFRKHNCKIVTC